MTKIHKITGRAFKREKFRNGGAGEGGGEIYLAQFLFHPKCSLVFDVCFCFFFLPFLFIIIYFIYFISSTAFLADLAEGSSSRKGFQTFMAFLYVL